MTRFASGFFFLCLFVLICFGSVVKSAAQDQEFKSSEEKARFQKEFEEKEKLPTEVHAEGKPESDSVEPVLLKVTFENQFANPVDVYLVEQGTEDLYTTVPGRSVTVKRDAQKVENGVRDLDAYAGNVWRFKLRKGKSSQEGDSVTLYEYTTDSSTNQKHSISAAECLVRQVSVGREFLFASDGGVLVADDNPTPRHGAAVQGEPRVSVRPLDQAGVNENFRWIIQSPNYLVQPNPAASVKTTPSDKTDKKTRYPGAIKRSDDGSQKMKGKHRLMTNDVYASTQMMRLSEVHGENTIAISLQLKEYEKTFLTYDMETESWAAEEPPSDYEGILKFNRKSTFIVKLIRSEVLGRFILQPCVAPYSPPDSPPGTRMPPFGEQDIKLMTAKVKPAFRNRMKNIKTSLDLESALWDPELKDAFNQRVLDRVPKKPLMLYAVPWGDSADLASVERMSLLGISLDAGESWRQFEQSGVMQPTKAEIEQATTEGTFGVSSIEAIDYCRFGFDVINMDPFDLQKNGIKTGRSNPLFAKGSAGLPGEFYTSYGYRLPLCFSLVKNSGFTAIEESKMYFSQSEFLTAVSNDESEVENQSTNWNVSATVTVGTNIGVASVSGSVTAGGGGSTNLLYGAGSSYSNDVSTNASQGKTTVVRSKFSHEFWLLLNKKNLKLHEDFKKGLADLQLPDEPGKPPRAIAFFEKFGTHYSLAALFGARCTEFSAVDTSELVNYVKSSGGGFTKDGYYEGSNSTANSSSQSTKLEKSNKKTVGVGGAGSSFDSFDRGQVKDYIPIKVYFRPITDLLQADLVSDHPTHADILKCAVLRKKLGEQLLNYLSTKSKNTSANASLPNRVSRPQKYAVEIQKITHNTAIPSDYQMKMEAFLVEVPREERVMPLNDYQALGTVSSGVNCYAKERIIESGTLLADRTIRSRTDAGTSEDLTEGYTPFNVITSQTFGKSLRLCVCYFDNGGGIGDTGELGRFVSNPDSVGPRTLGFQPTQPSFHNFRKASFSQPHGDPWLLAPTVRSDRLEVLATGKALDGSEPFCGQEGVERFTLVLDQKAYRRQHTIELTFRRVGNDPFKGDGLPVLDFLESKGP